MGSDLVCFTTLVSPFQGLVGWVRTGPGVAPRAVLFCPVGARAAIPGRLLGDERIDAIAAAKSERNTAYG